MDIVFVLIIAALYALTHWIVRGLVRLRSNP
jgi:hypothetical protein